MWPTDAHNEKEQVPSSVHTAEILNCLGFYFLFKKTLSSNLNDGLAGI